MTPNQPNNFGFQWGNTQTSGNQPTGSSWGTTGNFGKPAMSGSNTFGGSFQATPSGQNASTGAVSQNAPANNPFMGSSLHAQSTNVPAPSGFNQPNSFGQGNVNMGGGFGQVNQSTSSTSFGFPPNQNPSSMIPSQGFQQPQGNQNAGGLFGSASSNTATVPFGQAANTQTGRISGFGNNSFGTLGNQSSPVQGGTGFSFGQGSKPGGQSSSGFGFGNAQNKVSNGSLNPAGSGFHRPSTNFGTSTPVQFSGASNTAMVGTSNFGTNLASQPATTNTFMQNASGRSFPFNANTASGGPSNLFGQVGTQSASATGNSFALGGGSQNPAQTGFGGFNQQQGGLFGASAQSVGTKPIGAQNIGGFQFGTSESGRPSTNLFSHQTGIQTTASSAASFGQSFGSNPQFSGASTQFGTTQGSLQQGGFGSGQSIQNNSLQLSSGTQPKPFSFGLSQGAQQSATQTPSLGGQSFGSALGSSANSASGGIGFGKPPLGSSSGFPGISSAPAQQTTFGSNSGIFPSATSGPSSLPDTKSTPFTFGASQTNSTQTGGTTLPTPTPLIAPSSTGTGSTLSFPSSVSNSQPVVNFSSPLINTSNPTCPEIGKTNMEISGTSGDSSLFTIDKSIDVTQQSHTLRSEYAFIDRDEFERFHPIMQKLLILDNRSRVSHPEYKSRGFLIEHCDADKNVEMRNAMKQENADIQDIAFPDTIRSEWTKCAKEAILKDENTCPVPCAGPHVLGRRCELYKEETKKNHSALQALLDELEITKNSSILNQQWLDEYCMGARLKVYTQALCLQKQLLMLRNKGDVLTTSENKLEEFVNEISNVLYGKRSFDSMEKYCCGPEFFEQLCGKAALSEIVDSFPSRIESNKHSEKENGEKVQVLNFDDSHSIMGVLESLESIREGTHTVLELLDADKNTIESIENEKMP